MKKLMLMVRLGVSSLLLHKLRAFLAVLGILIGIAAVIGLVAMGEGISYQAQQQIKDLGATNIIVRSVKPAQESSQQGNRSLWVDYGVKRADFKRILSNLSNEIESAVPMREIRKEVRFVDKASEARLVGCTPEYFALNHLRMARGRFLTDADQEDRKNICVIADGLAEKIFGFENPIGKSVQIDRDFYTVVGRTASRDPTAAIGGSLSSQDYNMDIYIPLATLQARIGDMVFSSRSGSREGEIVELSQITLSVAADDIVEPTADAIRHLLEQFHEQEDFAVVVPKELLRQAELFRLMFNVLLVLIAGTSLAVGGIGIMNIMLATVTERTREIGIRRALGARRIDIIQQFLVESVVLTGVGGALGIAIGFMIGPAVSVAQASAESFMPDVMLSVPPAFKNLRPMIMPWSIWLSVGISVFVGLGFGLYPAYRAAMMDPIEALRHE